MKICLLSFEYPPETGFGGIGTYTWYQARALSRLGHEVHVLAGSRDHMPLRTREADGVTVHRFRPGGPLMQAFDSLGRLKWWWTRQRLENGWSMYRGLKTLVRSHRFDILEMPECGAEGYLINYLAGIPAVVRFHSPSRLIMPFYEVQPGDVTACSFLEQRAIRSASALTACSRFLGGEVREKLGVSAPVEVIPNGIDLSLFDREMDGNPGLPSEWPKDKLTILFSGRLERRKGIHLCGPVIQAILRDHDVAVVFAGQDLFGYMESELLPSLAGQKLRGSVHYLGKLDLPQLRSCVRAAGIFLSPSLWENCPYSVLEAMAARCAVVASDQGGMPELIQHGVNGLLAKCGDAESFAGQLRKLIADEHLRRRLGQEARHTVEQRFTDDRSARLSLQVYERCLAPTGRSDAGSSRRRHVVAK